MGGRLLRAWVEKPLLSKEKIEARLAAVEALERCKKELGVRTILGVSNISFGLPCRAYLNTIFLTLALDAGLDLAIMDPASPEMMAAISAYAVLSGRDRQCAAYIDRYAGRVPAASTLARMMESVPKSAPPQGAYGALLKAVEQGLRGESAALTHQLLEKVPPLTVVDEALIPALDAVGGKYERGQLFLPQLLQAASAAQSAFEEIRAAMAKDGSAAADKGRIVLATVKGDVHDKLVPVVCVLSPVLSWVLQWALLKYCDYTMSFELLLFNAAFTVIGLLLLRKGK